MENTEMIDFICMAIAFFIAFAVVGIYLAYQDYKTYKRHNSKSIPITFKRFIALRSIAIEKWTINKDATIVYTIESDPVSISDNLGLKEIKKERFYFNHYIDYIKYKKWLKKFEKIEKEKYETKVTKELLKYWQKDVDAFKTKGI